MRDRQTGGSPERGRAALAQLAESGAVTPVIDRTYPLDYAAEAIKSIASGHATGKAVVLI